MAYRKPADTPFARKIKVLEKLFSSGVKTEKNLQALGMEQILNIQDITVADMSVILELQRNTKSHTLFSYLGGDEGSPAEQ